MKKTIFFTLCLSAFITFSAAAKIWRVNNNPGVTADFTDLQTAIDSPNVLDDDTIHIEPSPNAYLSATGTVIINKRLTILGNGYYLTENLNNQANTYSSTFTQVFYFVDGSSGSSISGCTLGNVYVGNNNNLSTFSITISNNIIGNLTFQGASISAIVRNNYIVNINNGASAGSISIYNNYVGSGIALDGDPTNPVISVSGIISNNIIGNVVNVHSSIVKNNIFVNPAVGGSSYDAVFSAYSNFSNSNTVINNISIGLPLPSTGNNINNADINALFVGSTGYTTDSQWQLKSGSPAIGAGANGEDCGIFGGANPYKLSGLPAIPSIYSLTTGSSNATILPVTISVKSNN